MKYAVDAESARAVDSFTINEIGIPAVVLMERAAETVALKTAEAAVNFQRDVRIAAVCGCGNNGADGIAAARILTYQGLPVYIIIAGNEEHGTEEFKLQKSIAEKSGLRFTGIQDIDKFDILIDALLGTGLTRNIEGTYKKVINSINNSSSLVVSVDIPSGINADNGHIMGASVKADATITFGYNKKGMLLNPGRQMCGEITVSDIGFAPGIVDKFSKTSYFTQEDINKIPARITDSNKGTYGRTLIIAGSTDMSGAAYLSGLAAFRSGTGLVEICTPVIHAELIREKLPEAIVTGYSDTDVCEMLKDKLTKAACVILGPGLSTDETAEKIVKVVIDNSRVPIIIDADALNILAKKPERLKSCTSTVIITPHIGEMRRLTGLSSEQITDDPMSTAQKFACKYNVICVLKDSVTVVAEPGERDYINISGCAAMAKAGSGDVLTGIIAGMLSLRLEPYSAAAMGVYIHGLAGELAADEIGEHSILASDIANYVCKIIK